ncbi:MAG: 6-bladed beta-propeller [Bacteroidales bacterium]|nr:6-bladed beta-propeller [Bacteroidales bacterium]
MKKGVMIISFLMIIMSCNQKERPPYVVIDIEKNINKSGSANFVLNDIAQSMSLIPIETSDSVLFRNVIIVGVTEENLIIHGGNIGAFKRAIYFINRTDGKVSSVIDRHGRGPGEYVNIVDVSLNKRSNTLYLSDSRKINEYTFDGKFIYAIQNDSAWIVRMLDDGNFAVSYHPSLDMEFALGIYDNAWNLKRRGLSKAERGRKFDMIYFDGIFEFNGDYFYKMAHCDTLYRITSAFDEPYLVHSKGRYQIPIDIKVSREKTEKYGNRYIQHDYGNLISKYYFLSYYYDGKYYKEIWDIETPSLVYKSIFSRTGGVNGVPVIIDGKKIYVWPAFVSEESLYCIVEAEDAISLIPSLTEDSNPVILEVKLKAVVGH